MKKTSYRSMLRIYLLLFLAFMGLITLAVVLVLSTILVKGPEGDIRKSDWPQSVTKEFGSQIVFSEKKVQVSQKGIEFLQDEQIGLQILDGTGSEIYGYQKPSFAGESYSHAELLNLIQTGRTEGGWSTFVETISFKNRDYTYLLYFPMRIQKVTMYLNGERFSDGKTMALVMAGVLSFAILLIGTVYGIYTARTVKKMSEAIGDIAEHSYQPVRPEGTFANIYERLNALDGEIKSSDRLRRKTERLREEWIANITHDLKTPLSPVKGYAEILCESPEDTALPCRRYGKIILKNVRHIEILLDDLKLTYQLENEMFPVNKQEKDIVRFLKELVIDILNMPEYEERKINFESKKDIILFEFDENLLKRAFDNLLLNSFVHGNETTEIAMQVSQEDGRIEIIVSDNGQGMSQEEMDNLFERYYRGIDTGKRTEGTGLGMAIAKSIIELHNGTIQVTSVAGRGTEFYIIFSD